MTPETIPPPSRPGTVVLGLGADTGALILYTGADLAGREIEISPADAPGARRTHSCVRARHTAGSIQYAAVYPDLPAGPYTIWRDQTTPAAAVTVTGGHITICQWPA
jgi:hypothetical protein